MVRQSRRIGNTTILIVPPKITKRLKEIAQSYGDAVATVTKKGLPDRQAFFVAKVFLSHCVAFLSHHFVTQSSAEKP